ncbi:MAG: hypothetical protein P0Y60_02965 [Candidatus Microbacterium colombiense]|nr:MAG: hypothetical protein P0Y60_02965 [Microbacterium sp.]
MTDLAASPARRVPLGLAIGAAGAVIGLLPGVIGGGRLPAQNLWATQTLPEDMPFALLPISQYTVGTVLCLFVVGGVAAGLGIRALRRRNGIPAWSAAVGLAAVHLIAIVQTFAVLAVGLGISSGDRRVLLYFGGMLGGAVVVALLAQLGFWLTSQRSAGPVALGVALAAVPATMWLASGLFAFTGPVVQPLFVSQLVQWLPVIIVGFALAWCGVRPLRRLGVWAAALLALWVTPALFTAVSYGLGMRVLKDDLPQMAAASIQLFPVVLVETNAWLPVVIAAGGGALGALVWSRIDAVRDDASHTDAMPGAPVRQP